MEHQSSLVLIPGLPNDLALRCLVRVPRRYHGAMKGVCREWKHCVTTQMFFSLRKKLGFAEGWLYVLSRDKSEFLHWHVMDPATRTWMQLPPMPEGFARRYGVTCVAAEEHMYFMGGCGKFEEPWNKVVRYDAVRNKWEENNSMGVPRCYFVGGSIDEKVYAIGGMGLTAGTLTSWEVFDVKTSEWCCYDDPIVVSDLGESVVIDGRIYVRHASPSVVPPSYAAVFDPSQNSWSTLDNKMTQQWCGPATVVIREEEDDDVYMLDQTLGIRVMVLDKQNDEWCSVGRLSPLSIRTPCRIAAIRSDLYVVGRGLKTIVLDMKKAKKSRGVLVTCSVDGLQSSSEDIVISCNVIQL